MLTWIYEQKTGVMLNPQGEISARGYSGHGGGLNNPDMEEVPSVGPIPRGDWSIDLTPLGLDHGLGPLALPLLPVNHGAHGRSAFRIHGDNSSDDRSASHGCIILPRSVRQAIIDSGVTHLLVTHG